MAPYKDYNSLPYNVLQHYMLQSWAIWDKLLDCIFENFEIAQAKRGQVKRGQFQNFQKSQG